MARTFGDLSDDELIDLILVRAAHRGAVVESSCDAGMDQLALTPPNPRLAPHVPAEQHVSVGDVKPSRSATLAVTAERCDIATYRPLDSIWYGEDDADLIEELLSFYPHQEPRSILDATVNGRRFWKGSVRPVVGLDIDPRHRPEICADNAAMPFRSGQFDVVVYDPPHIPNQGSDRSKDFNVRFGLGARSAKENGYTFSHTYPAFMAEAWRVLISEGILLCKIADYVHNHRYQWAHIDLIRAGQEAGFTACDCIIKVRRGPIIAPKWKVAHHSRRQHCYWIIFRKSNRCE
jgi:hypothetical protein